MSVEGAFYPNDVKELNSSFSYFNELIEQHFKDAILNYDVKALIVPHAGYAYSGFTANLAYRNVKKTPKRVVVIGPSHRVTYEGASLVAYSSYVTPGGDIEADKEYINFLTSKFNLCSNEVGHREHSTEVQFPFIKHYFPNSKLIEIVYSHNPILEELIETILQDDDTLLIISTDLSHFYTQKEANILDSYCVEGIETQNLDLLSKGEACGMLGVIPLIKVSKKLSLHVKGIDYRTSGDITGDINNVVGYYSALVY